MVRCALVNGSSWITEAVGLEKRDENHLTFSWHLLRGDTAHQQWHELTKTGSKVIASDAWSSKQQKREICTSGGVMIGVSQQ